MAHQYGGMAVLYESSIKVVQQTEAATAVSIETDVNVHA